MLLGIRVTEIGALNWASMVKIQFLPSASNCTSVTSVMKKSSCVWRRWRVGLVNGWRTSPWWWVAIHAFKMSNVFSVAWNRVVHSNFWGCTIVRVLFGHCSLIFLVLFILYYRLINCSKLLMNLCIVVIVIYCCWGCWIIVQMRGLLSYCQCMIVYAQKGALNIVVVALSCMTYIIMSLLLKEASCIYIKI